MTVKWQTDRHRDIEFEENGNVTDEMFHRTDVCSDHRQKQGLGKISLTS